MKTILRSVSLAALIATSIASGAQAEAFKGFYVGGQLGWSHEQMGSNVRMLNKNTFLWGAHVGMSTVASNNIYMGAEVDFDFKSGNYDTRFNPSAVAKLGYRFAPQFVLAGKAGVTYNRFRVSAANNFVSQEKSRCGLALGAEALYSVTEHNIIGLSYQYDNYGSMRFFNIVKVKPTAHALTAKYSYKF